MKLLLIGGTGFVGPGIVEQALAGGHEVAVYHRGQNESDLLPEVSHIHGSTLEIGGHLPEISNFRPDAVIDTTQFRTDTTQSVIAALTGLCGRYVLVSSADVYRGYGVIHRTEPGPHQEMPVDEPAALRTLPSFDQTATEDNIFAERAALQQTDLPSTIVRAPAIFGRGDKVERIRPALDAIAAAGKDGVVRIAETRAKFLFGRGYLPNVADALILCAEDRRPGNHVFNVQYEEMLTWEEWWRLIAEVSRWKGRLERVPDSESDDDAIRTQDLSQHLYMDTSKIRRELGYTEAVPLDEAVRRSVEWEQSRKR